MQMSYKSCWTWQLCLSGSCASRTVQFLRMLGINRARIVRVFTCGNAVTGYAIAMPTALVMPILCLRLVEQDAKAEKLDLGLSTLTLVVMRDDFRRLPRNPRR